MLIYFANERRSGSGKVEASFLDCVISNLTITYPAICSANVVNAKASYMPLRRGLLSSRSIIPIITWVRVIGTAAGRSVVTNAKAFLAMPINIHIRTGRESLSICL